MQTNLNNNFQKSDIGLRIEKIISLLGMKQNAFAEILDVSTGRLSNILTGRNKPDSVFLSKIAIAFKDDINTAWLLTGEGEPLLRNVNISRSQNKSPLIKPTNDPTNISKSEKSLVGYEQKQLNEPPEHYQNKSINHHEIENLKKEIQTLKGVIQMQEMTIKAYESAIKAQETTIETLKAAKFSTQVPMLATAKP